MLYICIRQLGIIPQIKLKITDMKTSKINYSSVKNDLANSEVREYGVFTSYPKELQDKMIQAALKEKLYSIRNNEYAIILEDKGNEIVYSMKHWNEEPKMLIDVTFEDLSDI